MDTAGAFAASGFYVVVGFVVLVAAIMAVVYATMFTSGGIGAVFSAIGRKPLQSIMVAGVVGVVVFIMTH